MKNSIYLFIVLMIIGLSISSCEQAEIASIAETPEVEISESTTYIYQGEEYEVTTREGVTDVPDALSEVWSTGTSVILITGNGNENYLFDNQEKSDEFFQQLVSTNTEVDLEVRADAFSTFYEYPNLGGSAVGFSPGGHNVPQIYNNKFSSVYINNNTNSYYRVICYDYPNYGRWLGYVVAIPYAQGSANLGSRKNNKISSVWGYYSNN